MQRSVERILLIALGVALRHLIGQHAPSTVASTAGSFVPTAPAHIVSVLNSQLTQQQHHQPNVIITLLDDAGAGDAGVLGHPLLRTPHIDAFAADAVSFSQAYAGAPNCSPSRAALLTGRASYRTGVYDFLSKSSGSMHLDRRERTIANILRNQAGYATAHFGKWHLSRGRHGHPPSRFGFEHSNGSFLASSVLLRSFVGWVRHGRSRADQPFFAYLALWEPHEPVHRWSPQWAQRAYAEPIPAYAPLTSSGERADILSQLGISSRQDHTQEQASRLGTRRRRDDAVHGRRLRQHHKHHGHNQDEPTSRKPPTVHRQKHPFSPLKLEELAPSVASGGGGCAWRLPRRNPARIYYGAMTQVDDSFGTMLQELELLGVRENTMVVLTSDNGPEHREANSWGSSGGLRGAKGYVYEGGIRIPLLVQWPAVLKKPFVIHEPVHQWDLLPTICDLVGVSLPPDRTIDGVSILGLLHNQGSHYAAKEEGGQADLAAKAVAEERHGRYVRLSPHGDALPPPPPLVLGAPQSHPLPRPSAAGARDAIHELKRTSPLFWAMHRGRGGMQYALRMGPWKLLGGYGDSAAHGDGPVSGAEVVPWLRGMASIGRVELYLLSHDPAERVDLSASQPDVVALMLPELSRMIRETAHDGPEVVGWGQRSCVTPDALSR